MQVIAFHPRGNCTAVPHGEGLSGGLVCKISFPQHLYSSKWFSLLHRQCLSIKGFMRMTNSIYIKYFFLKVHCLHITELWRTMMVLVFPKRSISKLRSYIQRKGSSLKSWKRNPDLCFPLHKSLHYHMVQSAPLNVRAELKRISRTRDESVG